MRDGDLARALILAAALAAFLALACALSSLKDRLTMFGLTWAKLIGPLALAAAMFAAGVAVDRTAPLVGANAQIHRAKADRDAWKAASAKWQAAQAGTRAVAIGWATSFGEAETQRSREHTQAVAAVTAAQSGCDARVAAARRSALAIQSLVTKEVPRDPQGCPVRQLVDPRELFDAVRPAAPAG